MLERDKEKPWRDGVYLCTVNDSLQAEIFESKLRSEDIPCIKRYVGAANFLEITMGVNTIQPIEIYVPEQLLKKAKEVIVSVPIEDDFEEVEE